MFARVEISGLRSNYEEGNNSEKEEEKRAFSMDLTGLTTVKSYLLLFVPHALFRSAARNIVNGGNW